MPGQTGWLDAQSYSLPSPGQSVTGSRAGTLAALGNGIFAFFKGGKFGGHVAANVTVALSPKLRDQINGYMHSMFGTYSKQVNQDTKKLQDSNVQLQKDLKKDQGSQNQQDIKNLGNQIGTESGQLQKDISQYQKGTAQGVYDILNKYNQQQQKKSQQAPAPGLPPAKQNDPASGTRPPFNPPAGQSTTGAPPNPGGTSNQPRLGFPGRVEFPAGRRRPVRRYQYPARPGPGPAGHPVRADRHQVPVGQPFPDRHPGPAWHAVWGGRDWASARHPASVGHPAPAGYSGSAGYAVRAGGHPAAARYPVPAEHPAPAWSGRRLRRRAAGRAGPPPAPAVSHDRVGPLGRSRAHSAV